MPSGANVEITAERTCTDVVSVFEAMLACKRARARHPGFQGDPVDIRCSTWRRALERSGAGWECDRGQACRFAGRFSPWSHRRRWTTSVARRARELANMIGGNLKPVLTPGIRLSMPTRSGWLRLQPAGVRGQDPAAACLSIRRGPLLDHHPDHAIVKAEALGRFDIPPAKQAATQSGALSDEVSHGTPNPSESGAGPPRHAVSWRPAPRSLFEPLAAGFDRPAQRERLSPSTTARPRCDKPDMIGAESCSASSWHWQPFPWPWRVSPTR